MENKQIEEFNKIKFDSFKIVEEVKDLKVIDINDKKGYEAVRAGKMKLVKQRTFIKEERLTITRVFDKFKKDVMGMEKEILEVMEPTEKILAERQQKIDDEKEIINRKKSLPERIERLETIEHEIIEDFILSMSDKQFDEYFNIKHTEYLEEKARKIKEKEDKIERETEILKAKEDARVEAIETAEKKRKDDIEVLRLKSEKEKQDIIDGQKRKDDKRIAKEKEDKRLEDEKIAKEKEEQTKKEKNKKYIKFLVDNGYNEKTKDNFYILREDNKFTIYKKINSIIIK